jgi:hypothetical protein
VGKPNERDLLAASGNLQIAAVIHLAAKKITYNTKLSLNLLSRNSCHSLYSCTALLKSAPWKMCPQKVVVPSLLYGRPEEISSRCLKNRALTCLDFHAQFSAVRIHTVRPVTQQENTAALNRSSSLEFVPTISW